MKFLANENIPLASVHALRKVGHDVLSMTEESPGASDEMVIRRAYMGNRIIVTFDRDYGELIFRRRLATPDGVLYFRFSPATPLEPADYIARLIASGIELSGKFTTAERERVRQRSVRLHSDYH
uniref:Predicted nuclease, contains PIN domain, potential toxin-antitoxin system component n=1 Tax=Candidatus Kentrum eta TaxID=2126337 RepID=A0A450V1V0_9GAMM|nr:MAG: Predicted nuclease, contains PIN domain, potential toxin-antitoxin system component [Candidatus Kentron sp. H]VFJ99026.1 MAG: Predicted nuclease, contains PIN domain, potential toxin-antitoxin system component [Candidatus Kentron sp. H]VFK03784.1 MAG: Predicted nuclease, contains PIN domain, potential toxin-antitoxin system component [Candidatus Kentron sp. H]